MNLCGLAQWWERRHVDVRVRSLARVANVATFGERRPDKSEVARSIRASATTFLMDSAT